MPAGVSFFWRCTQVHGQGFPRHQGGEGVAGTPGACSQVFCHPIRCIVRTRQDRLAVSLIICTTYTTTTTTTTTMDGSAQSEYLHCTMPGLQGPRVNLTYRWVAQHTASCPLAGVVGCLLPSCVQGLAEPGSRLWEKGENNWSFSWELAFLLFILMSVPLVSIWMNTRKECRHSGQRLSCSLVHFPSRGRARCRGIISYTSYSRTKDYVKLHIMATTTSTLSQTR